MWRVECNIEQHIVKAFDSWLKKNVSKKNITTIKRKTPNVRAGRFVGPQNRRPPILGGVTGRLTGYTIG